MAVIAGSDSRMIPPLGPDRVRQRMEEIRARLASMAAASFEVPDGQAPFSLSGAIGAGGSEPVDPFGAGQGVQPLGTPNIKEMIRGAALRNGVDPELFDALVATESAYNPAARSKVGAMGLAQLMPATAASLGVTNPFDPAQNLDGGARYLRQMLTKFGSIEHALAAYNAGPGAVAKYGGVPPFEETRGYVERIMRLYSARRGQ